MADEEKELDVFHREFFMCFSVGTDPEVAKEKFRKRYKIEPEMCVIETGMLWVGPIYGFRKGEVR